MHTHLTEADREQAALFALGALEPAEHQAFAAHLDAGCAACAAEVASFTSLMGDLALAASPAVPPPGLRTRVLDEVDRLARGAFHFRFADEGEWREIAAGVSRRDLGRASFLIRLSPGCSLPRHRHHVVEHCYVLEGDLRVNDRRLTAGDYHQAGPGTLHEGLTTDGGCTFLVVESADAIV